MARLQRRDVQTSRLFLQYPTVLLYSEEYQKIRLETRTAYVMMLDRTRLSLQNNWVNANGEVYIRMKNDVLEKSLGKSTSTIRRIKKELKDLGWIDEEPNFNAEGKQIDNIIYVHAVDIETYTGNLGDDLDEYNDVELILDEEFWQGSPSTEAQKQEETEPVVDTVEDYNKVYAESGGNYVNPAFTQETEVDDMVFDLDRLSLAIDEPLFHLLSERKSRLKFMPCSPSVSREKKMSRY